MSEILRKYNEIFSNSFVQVDEQNELEEIDRIALSLAGRSLFITGGTGFMGLVLIEKILRSCTDVKKMYILVRHKKGKTSMERIKHVFDDVLFDKVKQQIGIDVILSKVEGIYGDMSLPNLGISSEDIEKLRNEVSIVYHAAATVRFDEPLRHAIHLNVRGTQQMLELAATFKHLALFCYVATASAHQHEKILLERSYEPPSDPHTAMAACEWLTDEHMATIESKILGEVPNTYIYSKALAETLVVEKFKDLPAVILRPSIVMPVWQEPVPGWTNNMFGPIGLYVAAGKGVLRTMYGNPDTYGDLVPADICINSILVATWYYLDVGVDKAKSRIINVTNSKRIIHTWGDVIEAGRYVVEKHVPFNGAAWYPGGSMTSNKLIHWIRLLLFQWIPAILGDALLPLFGHRPFLIKIQKRLIKGVAMLEHFTKNVREYENSQLITCQKSMNGKERLTYKMDFVGLNLNDYIKDVILSVRRLVLKESDETLPAARIHMQRMWYVDKIWKALWIIGLACMLYCYFT